MSIATEIQRLQQAKADIKTAIEKNGVTVGDGTIDTYAEKISEISVGGSGDYEQGYEDGKNSVVPIERYLKAAQFTSLNMFGKSEAVLNLDNVTVLTSLFNTVYQSEEDLPNKNNTVEHLTINCKKTITQMNNAFYVSNSVADEKLIHLTLNFDKSRITTYYNAFIGLRALQVIDGEPLDFSAVISPLGGMFNQCYALTDFRVVVNTIKRDISVSSSGYLNTETIQSIIDGLADLTGGTAQTLTLHATVGGKLTDEQKATITAKNWTLVY